MEELFVADLSKRPLQLRLHPDAVLRRISEPVPSFTAEMDDFMGDMLAFMKEHNGIGLAAPQVGINLRILVAEIEGRPLMIANPEIVGSTKMAERKEEGCLSIPNRTFDVERHCGIEVKARTAAGGRIHFEAEGLFARVLQHEIDHLDGVLICDNGIERQSAGKETPDAYL
jgi:peptide deformylase